MDTDTKAGASTICYMFFIDGLIELSLKPCKACIKILNMYMRLDRLDNQSDSKACDFSRTLRNLFLGLS